MCRSDASNGRRFTGKRGLDIGTNEGLIPLSVAVKYRTACFDGIDIDNDLVHKVRAAAELVFCAALRHFHEIDGGRPPVPAWLRLLNTHRFCTEVDIEHRTRRSKA